MLHGSDVLSAALDGGTAIGVMLVYFWYVVPNSIVLSHPKSLVSLV